MAFIEEYRIKLGSRVVARCNISNLVGLFEKGTEFEVIGVNERGFDLRDDEGNIVTEVIPSKVALVKNEDKMKYVKHIKIYMDGIKVIAGAVHKDNSITVVDWNHVDSRKRVLEAIDGYTTIEDLRVMKGL